MPTWKVKFTEEARTDFKKLDGSQKNLVGKQLIKLERDPSIGKPPGDKMGMDLAGYYKLYADKKKLRVVYAIEGDMVNIVAIGEREGMDVYRLAASRIKPKLQ